MQIKKLLFSERLELSVYALIFAGLVIPSFFINLGMIPMIEDEATRALVTLEMDISKNYIVPTVGGSYYYNKPPLFNWMVLPFFKAGGYNELMLRLPTVISLLLFSITIFLFVRKQLSDRIAFIAAIMFLTCGRILIYESLKGLIDITFSWVLFSNFMFLYTGVKNRKYSSTFLVSYLLLAVAFMLKGLPALVFQVITVLTILILWDRWKIFKILVSWQHLLGLLLFILLIGSYYLAYFRQNPGSESEMLEIIFQQSARRTALRFGVGTMMVHLVTYPFEFAMHFLPWTLLVIYFFRKGSRELMTNKFIKYTSCVFLTNIVVYWTSPESFPRYVLMLVPMVYIVLVYLVEELEDGRWLPFQVLKYVFCICFVTALVGISILPFLPQFSGHPQVWLKSIALFLGVGSVLAVSLWQPRNLIIHTAIFLLIVRVGFNWFVLPYRLTHSKDTVLRSEAAKIGRFAQRQNVYIYGKPFKNFNEDASIKYVSFFTRFYIASSSGKIIKDSSSELSGGFYLANKKDLESKSFRSVSSMEISDKKQPLMLVQFK